MYPWGAAHSERRIAELRELFGVAGPVWPVGGDNATPRGAAAQGRLPVALAARAYWEGGKPDVAIEALRAAGLWEVFGALAKGCRKQFGDSAGLRRAFGLLATFERARAAAAEAMQHPEVRGASFATGDLFCPGVDIEKFKAENRVPMFPGKWQAWKLYRTDRDNPSAEDIHHTARAVVLQWFKTIEAGGVDHIETVTGPPAGSKRVKRWQDNPAPMSVHAKTPIVVWVSFVYRGSRTDGPWPVHKAQIVNPWCPVDADWMLGEVWLPDEKKPVPEAPIVPELIRPDVEKGQEWLGQFGAGFGSWLAIVALVGVTVAAAAFGRSAGR
jgi:hypothetical protein